MQFSSEENILLSTVQAGDQTQQKKRDKCDAESSSNCFVGRGMVTLTYCSFHKVQPVLISDLFLLFSHFKDQQ